MIEIAKTRATFLALTALVIELAREIVEHGAGDEQEMSLVPRAQDIVANADSMTAEIGAMLDLLEKELDALEGHKQGVRDAAQIVENARALDAIAARTGPNVDTLLRFQSAGAPLTSEEQEMVRRHREAEASRPETPKVWAGGPGDPNGNPNDAVLLDVGARVELLPPSKGRLSVDCSALRIELTPDDKPVPGVVIAKLKRARYHDEQDTIEVDFDAHGRAVVDALRIRFVSAPV